MTRPLGNDELGKARQAWRADTPVTPVRVVFELARVLFVLALLVLLVAACGTDTSELEKTRVAANMEWLDMYGTGGKTTPIAAVPCPDGLRFSETREYVKPEPGWMINWRGGILKAGREGYTVTRDNSWSRTEPWSMSARDHDGYAMIVRYNPATATAVLTSEGPCS